MPHRFFMFATDEADRMREAFDSAWRLIEESGSALASPVNADGVRETLALKIVELVREAGPSVVELRDAALRHLGFVTVDVEIAGEPAAHANGVVSIPAE